MTLKQTFAQNNSQHGHFIFSYFLLKVFVVMYLHNYLDEHRRVKDKCIIMKKITISFKYSELLLCMNVTSVKAIIIPVCETLGNKKKFR